MADLGDVADTLVSLASAAIYPNGVSAGSPLGINVRVYRGHPGAKVLDGDIVAGFTQAGGAWSLTTPTARIAHVVVNSRAGVGRVMKPYVFAGAQVQAVPAQTLTVTASGTTVTLGGTIAAGQGAAVSVNGALFGAAAGPNDTLSTLATSLAGLISATTSATASGPVISIPAAVGLKANGFVQVQSFTEMARQVQGFEFTIYAPGRDVRDAVSRILQPALTAATRFVLPDGTQAKMELAPPIQVDDDKPEKEMLFVRRLFYAVEFPVMAETTTATQAIIATLFENTAGTVLATSVEA